MSYNRKELKVRYEGEGTKPRKKKKNPNTADISSMGYRDDSPYRNLPYIDIHTPDGTIDMSATGIPLLANGRVLPPYSGIHQFDTTQVKEIPLAQKGGWLGKYQKAGSVTKKYNVAPSNQQQYSTSHYDANDLYYSDMEYEKERQAIAQRSNQCRADGSGCLGAANAWYNKFVADKLGNPSSWDELEYSGVYSAPGKTYDSWDVHGLDNRQVYYADNNSDLLKKFQYAETDWKKLDLPIGAIIGYGHHGTNYSQESLNAKKGLPAAGHSGRVVAFDKDTGEPWIYDTVNGLHKMSQNKYAPISVISADNRIVGNTYSNLQKGKYAYSDKSSPIEVQWDRFIDEEGKEISWDEDEYIPFIKSYVDNKPFWQGIIGVKDDEYNELVKIAGALAISETEGGNDNSWRFDYGIPLPGYTIDKMGLTNSTGITQLNHDVIKNLYNKHKDKFHRYGLFLSLKDQKKEGRAGKIFDFNDPDPQDAAFITMLLLKDNIKVAENYYNRGNKNGKSKNNPKLTFADKLWYSYNSPSLLLKGEAWGDAAMFKKFKNAYNALNVVKIDQKKSKQKGGEIPKAQNGGELKEMLDKISRKKKLPKVPKSELILKDDLLFPTDEADVPIPYEYPVDADIYFKNLQPAQWFIDRENWRKSNPQQQPLMEVKKGGSKFPPHLPEAYKKGGWLKKYQTGSETGLIGPPEETKSAVVRQIGVDAEGTPIQRPTTDYYLPTIDITAEKEDTYNNYMLDKYRDAGLGEALFMAPLDYVFGYPQAAMTKLMTGKYQLPSEAMGVENAAGAFLLDAFIDPTNVVGAGLFKNTAKGITARNLFKKGAREVVEDVGLPALTSTSFKRRTVNTAARIFGNLSKKAKDPAIKDHFLGLQLGLHDIANGRSVFETFPLTKAQKAKVFAQQDAAHEIGENFVKDWIYNGNMDFRQSVFNKMQNLGRSTGETFKFPAEHIKLDLENPLIKLRGKLIDSRRAAIRELAKNDPTINVKTLFEKRGKAGGFILGNSGNYTYRNHGLYAIRPSRIADVAAHELSHVFQKNLGFRVNPDKKIVGKGFGGLNTIWDTSVTPYYYPNPNTMYGQLFGEYMTKPKLFSDLRDEIFQKRFGKSHDDVEKTFGEDVFKKIVEKKFGESYDDVSARLFNNVDSSGKVDVSHWTQRERDLLNEASEEYWKKRKPYSDAIAEFDKKKQELWDEYYTWAASPDELHSELMVARKNMAYKLFADSRGSASWEEVLQALREPTDEVIDLMIQDQNLNRFFGKDTPQEIKRSLIKALPAFGGAGFIYGASEGQPEPEPQMYKKGGWLKKYQKGGTKEKGYYVSNTPYVEGTDYSEGRVPANYWTGSSVPKDIIYSGGTLPAITIKPEAEDENQILENTMLVGATTLAALLTKKKVNPAVIRKIRMDVKRAANTIAKPDMKVIYEPETPLQQIANKTYWTGEYLKRPGLFLEHMGLRRPGYMNMDQNNWQNYLVQTGINSSSKPTYMRLGKQGFDPSSSGSFNEGIYYLKDYPRQVVKFDTYGYQPDELRDLLSKVKKLKMKNTALPLKAVEKSPLTDWSDLLIYNKLPYGNPRGIGKSKMVGIRYMTLEDLEKIPQKAWDDLGKRAEELAKNDIYIDYVGPNVVYDKVKKTFVIYDPALATPPGQIFNAAGFDWNKEILMDIPYKPDADKKTLIKKALEEMIFNPRNNAGFIHSVQQRIKPELDKDILKRKTLIGDFASQLDPFDVLELQRILKTRPPESFQLQRGHTKKIISDLQNELDALNNTSFINDKKIRLKAEDVLVDRKIIDEFRNHFDKSISKIRNIKKKGGAAGSAWLNKYQDGGEMEIVRNQEKLEPVPQEDIVKIIKKASKKQKTDSVPVLETKESDPAEDLWAYEQDVMAEEKASNKLKNAFKTPEQMLSSGQISKKQYDSIHDVEYYHDKDVVKALYDKDGNVIYHSGDYGMYKNPLADPFESAVNNLPLVEITAEKTAKQRLSDFTKAFPGYALSLMAGGPAGMMLWAAYNQAKGNIAEMNTAGGYSIPLEDFAKAAFGDSDKKLPGEPIDMSVATESDAFRMYMGQDQVYSSFYPSPYQEGAYEINGYHNYFPEKFDNFPSQKTIQHENERTQNTRMGEFKPWGDMAMGRHQISSGEDERGKYIEYYDLWDLDTYKNDIDIPGTDVSIKDVPIGEMIDKTIGKPFPIRGRVYYKKDPKTGEYVREDLLKKRGGVIRKNRK